MQRYWIVVAMLLLARCVAIAQVPERVQYVADIDSWRVEVFAGVVHPRTVLQGPIREAGFQEPIQMCFLPSGEGLITTGGVIMLLKDRTVRYLAGVPGRPGYQDGPAGQALLGRQLSICPDGKGGAYIGDRSNRCIRRLTRKAGRWVVETVAGDPKKPASELQLARVRDEGKLGPASKSDVIDGVGRKCAESSGSRRLSGAPVPPRGLRVSTLPCGVIRRRKSLSMTYALPAASAITLACR
jgi:hypothetical protein